MKKLAMIALLLVMAVNGKAQDNHLPDIKVDVSTMMPMKYQPRNGLSGFSLELRNDSAFVYLPYMGEVYSAVPGGGGLNFSEPCSAIAVSSTKKKDGQLLSFDVKHEMVSYKFRMTIYDNGNTDLFMQPSNAQSCNYMGEWTKSK